MDTMSSYNRSHLHAITTTWEACDALHDDELDVLRKLGEPYLRFRHDLDDFTAAYFRPYCEAACFTTRKSACCSYESIIVFFADEVMNYLFGGREDIAPLRAQLEHEGNTSHCVYLSPSGCLWTLRPITCAMFFCDDAKKTIFSRFPHAHIQWDALVIREKEFTWPTQPVLFDEVERFFIERGVTTPHMYFHRSPGLLRVKECARKALRCEKEDGEPSSLP